MAEGTGKLAYLNTDVQRNIAKGMYCPLPDSPPNFPLYAVELNEPMPDKALQYYADHPGLQALILYRDRGNRDDLSDEQNRTIDTSGLGAALANFGEDYQIPSPEF